MCVPGCRESVGRALSRRGFFGGAAAATFAATPALAQRSFTRVIDLTHTLSPAFPTFFGVPGIEIERRYTLKKDGANVNWWRVLEHAGTHIDAPIHYAENGAAIEAIAAEQLVVPLAVLDVSAKAARNADYALNRQDLTEWEGRHGRLPEGCCVAMHSGWARLRKRCREVHRQGRCRRLPFSRHRSRSGRMAAPTAPRRGACRGYAVARPRLLKGLQDSRALAACRPLGHRKHRQPGAGAADRRDADCRCTEGARRDRRAGADSCAGLGQALRCQRPFSSACQYVASKPLAFASLQRARAAATASSSSPSNSKTTRW